MIRSVFCTVLCLSMLTSGSIAAEANKKKAAPSFKRHPVLHTKYTKNCPSHLGLTKAPKEKPQGKTLDPKIYKRILKVHDAIGAEDFKTATELLKSLYERTKSRAYDHAIVSSLMGQVYSMQENYKLAIKYTKAAHDAKVFTGSRKRSIMRSLGALFIVTERYKEALKIYKQWIKTAVNPTPDDYVRLAIAYAYNKDINNAICPARIAINVSPTLPKQGLFDLLLSMHHQKKDYAGAINILKENLMYHPDTKKVWVNLAQFYALLKQPQNALASWELAYKKGLLDKEREFKHLANYYNMQEVPYKAAEVLQKELEKGRVESNEKHWRNVAYSWFQAREKEKALYAYGKAAGYAEDGELYVRQGELFADLEKWDKSIKAFKTAIKKGKLKKRREAAAYYRMGISYFYLGNIAQAKKQLKAAQDFSSHRSYAESWLNYIDDWLSNQKLLSES